MARSVLPAVLVVLEVSVVEEEIVVVDYGQAGTHVDVRLEVLDVLL